MNRRHILIAAPAMMACAAVPGAAVTPLSAVAMKFQIWHEHRDWLNGPATNGMPEAEFDAAVDISTNHENEMLEIPTRDALNVLRKIAAYTDFGAGELPSQTHLPAPWAEVQAILGNGGAA